VIREFLGTPVVVDEGLSALVTWLTPVVDRLAVVADNVAMARAVGIQEATVVELEARVDSLGSRDDLDVLAFELVAKHGDPFVE